MSGREAALQASHKVRQDLIDAGLVEHTDKCNWLPVQQVTWLGFNLDLEMGQIYMPTEKVKWLKSQLEQVLDRPTLKARELASIIGKLISMSLAVGPIACLITRSMFAVLTVETTGASPCMLPQRPDKRSSFGWTMLTKLMDRAYGTVPQPSALCMLMQVPPDMGALQ